MLSWSIISTRPIRGGCPIGAGRVRVRVCPIAYGAVACVPDSMLRAARGWGYLSRALRGIQIAESLREASCPALRTPTSALASLSKRRAQVGAVCALSRRADGTKSIG